MEKQSTIQNNNYLLIKHQHTEFHDAVEDFPFFDASNSFEHSDQLDEATVSVISEHTPDSPSSPSSAGLRHRRIVSPRSGKDLHQSQFFKNNPDGLIDYNPKFTSDFMYDNEKLKENLNLITVNWSDRDETDACSAVTSINRDERIDRESITVNSPYSEPNLATLLAELMIKVIDYQTKCLASSVTFPIWLMHSLYMLLTDPFAIIKIGKSYMLGNASGIWGICYSCVKVISYLVSGKHESIWKLCFRIGKGLLWLAFGGCVLVGLLVPAFLFSGVMMKWIVDEPIQITKQLTFDYTRDSPMAFAPIISCPESYSLVNSEKSKIGSLVGSRVVPFNHELQATVSLTLPESDYNRNLGIFQVKVDFLSDDGKLLASARQPCMLQFKSQSIRLLSTFFKLAPLLTGYSSETQTLDVNFRGYTEKDVHTSCARVVIEQRAEFARGGGFPEIYSASLKLESQLPFLKRVLWYWKGLIYIWISFMIFFLELLFSILCCIPIIFPGLRRVGGSSNNNASHSTPSGRS